VADEAKALKHFFDRARVELLAEQIAAAWAGFEGAAFVEEASAGLDALELMQRAEHIAAALHRRLPEGFEEAADVLEGSLGEVLPEGDNMRQGMAPFHYLPHVIWIAANGATPERFDRAMVFQQAVTRRFSAEFSIRAFWTLDRARTVEWMERWVEDEDAHVRRLVSEGTRPRLPWASKLRDLIADPRPALALVERLRDDPSLMVRRSVANHLNDVAKDHPALVVELVGGWLEERDSAQRRWIARHALRTLIKRGDKDALALMGHSGAPELALSLEGPSTVRLGEKAALVLTARNEQDHAQSALIDLVVHLVKADGKTNAKVFKLGVVALAPGEHKAFRKTVSFAPMTTRRSYAGVHRIEALINGDAYAVGALEVIG
jgi:3-methyladenine DNA glycosylase AlkC